MCSPYSQEFDSNGATEGAFESVSAIYADLRQILVQRVGERSLLLVSPGEETDLGGSGFGQRFFVWGFPALLSGAFPQGNVLRGEIVSSVSTSIQKGCTSIGAPAGSEYAYVVAFLVVMQKKHVSAHNLAGHLI